MRHHYAALILASLVAAPLGAQQWTPEQRSVIDHVTACWDAWGQEDPNVHDGPCRGDPAARFWWMTEGVPDYGPPEWKRWTGAFWPRIESIHYAHRPIAVQIFGDVAIYQYWVTWTHQDPNGQVVTMAQRRIDILQRRSGRWIFIGGAGAPETG